MIIVELYGGTGNQLFQYSAGRRLAHKHSTGMILRTRWFHHARPTTPFVLDQFKIKAVIDWREEDHYNGCPRIRERHTNFIPDIMDLPNNVLLDGYWQSEKYFSDIPEIIREETKLRNPLSKRSEEIKSLILSHNSVSIHIRRQDFLKPSRMKQVGLCSPEYYFESIRYIAERTYFPLFFIFGGEEKWARENLKIPHAIYVEHNGIENNYEDLHLMSLCKYNVIANSTFSWWAAWLNKCPDKIITYPVPWYIIDPRPDLIPSTWVGIKNDTQGVSCRV